MRSTLVYDLPTRLFHWAFAGLFLTSFVIAKTVDDESMTYAYHMLSGLLLAGLIVWRLIWGFIGSKHARFSGFDLNILHLKDYFIGMLSGSKKRWSGHNPASSWAAITMFSLGLGLAITGYLMSTGDKETFEDMHELLANSFIVIAGLHVAGVVVHSIRHRDLIALSMIDGKKDVSTLNAGIPNSRNFAAVFFIAWFLSIGVFLYKNFDSQTGTLSAFGQTLQLGESEDQEQEQGQESKEGSGSELESEHDDD